MLGALVCLFDILIPSGGLSFLWGLRFSKTAPNLWYSCSVGSISWCLWGSLFFTMASVNAVMAWITSEQEAASWGAVTKGGYTLVCVYPCLPNL